MLFLLIAQSLLVLALVMLSVAFFSLYERKLMGLIQIRLGPNKVILLGLLQPIADALKLLSKNEPNPYNSSKLLYYFPPVFSFFVSLFSWLVFPFLGTFLVLELSGVFVIFIFSVSVYGLIFSGWFSNSKYSILGCVRAIVQSISYEIGLSLILVVLFLSCNSLSLINLKVNQGLCLFMGHFFTGVLLFIMLNAELNRSPFDLAEGESELVGGYSVEYGGLSYTFIFLGENLSMVWICWLFSFLLFGGSMFVTIFLIFLFVWIRATMPRIRFDKLMMFFWVVSLPLIISLSCVELILS